MTKFDQQINFWAHMLDEAFDKEQFLCEDREGKNINRAEKWIKQNHPEVIGQKLQNGTTITPRILTQEIRNTVPNVRMADCKFLVGATRMYFDLQNDAHEFQSEMNKLNKMLKIICTAHADEYDNDFNGLSFEELDKKFSGAVKKELDNDREEIGKLQLVKNTAYTIIPIDSFKKAQKYRKYTSWCVTHYSNMYNNYTKDGLGRFYFCLQDGFESIPKAKGEGCPMDAYGKSMIAVGVNDDGSLNTCTCRWNHENGANDHMLDSKEISKFFGVDFYKTFKPYDIDQLWKKILKKQVPLHDLNDDETEFCKIFGCVAIYAHNDYADGSSIKFKKIIDGKIITLPCIDKTTTYINKKFVTMKDGKFVDITPKTIQNMPQDIKGEFVIPYGVMGIGKRAFYGCFRLASVTIPSSVTSIGAYAFCACDGLTSMTIPDNVTSIENSAFFNCGGLTSVTISNGITSIEPGVFCGCSSLESVMIPDSVMNIKENAFNGCKRLISVTIPNSVTNIGDAAFYSCQSLTRVAIPNSVTIIRSYTFCHCLSLTSMTIPDSVTSIEEKAFAYCSSLTSVTISDSVMSISKDVFDGCDKLANLSFEGKTFEQVKAMDNYPFGIEDESVIKCWQ